MAETTRKGVAIRSCWVVRRRSNTSISVAPGLDVTFGLKHGGPKTTLKPSARRRKKAKRGR